VPASDRVTHEALTGLAALSFDTASSLDPWHALSVRRVLGGTYSRADFTLPHGRVLRRY
jgi:hypothetical protein